MKTLFLEHISESGKDYNNQEYVDVWFTDYNLPKLRKLKEFSKLRWVKCTKVKLSPGHGEGTVTIGKEQFKVVYAWGGREIPNGGYNKRTSYTTRLIGKNIAERIRKLKEQIIKDEYGSLYYERPTKECYAEQNIHSVEDFREYTIKLTNNVKEILKKPHTLQSKTETAKVLKSFTKAFQGKAMEKIIETFKKQWDNNDPIKFDHTMTRIDSDMPDTWKISKPRNPFLNQW